MSAHQSIGSPEWVWDGCGWVRPGSCQPPPCPPPCPPFPPRPIQGPIAGVTTGAAARPGEVGEFLVGSAVVNIVVNPLTQTILAQPLVIPPGDWDIEAAFGSSVSWDALSFMLRPQPPGVTGNLQGFFGVFSPQPTLIDAVVISPRQQALVSIPTLLPFTISVFNTTVAGQGTLVVSARRMR